MLYSWEGVAVGEECGLRVVVTIPGVKLKTEGNRREHWAVAARRAKEHRSLARLFCSQVGTATRDRLRDAPRLRVRFVRIGGKRMDRTNLVSACKNLQDGVCEWLGVDDGSDWYVWEWPEQESGDHAVRVELTAVVSPPS